MAISRTKDGRVFVYCCEIGTGGRSAVKKKYFGRGPDAEAKAKEYNDGRNFQRHRPTIPRTVPTFGELAKLYTVKKRFSLNSEKHLLICLSANILPFFGNLQAIRIREDDVDRYVDKRLKKVKRLSTVRREITDLQAVLNFAVDRRIIAYNPLSRYRKPKADDEIITPPTVKEISAILKRAPEHLKRAVLISIYTGVRVGKSELFKIRWFKSSRAYQKIKGLRLVPWPLS
jgi:hypothetical protein